MAECCKRKPVGLYRQTGLQAITYNKVYGRKVHLKENLAYARKLQGLRQYELAERIGVKPNTISNYEKGSACPTSRRWEN